MKRRAEDQNRSVETPDWECECARRRIHHSSRIRYLDRRLERSRCGRNIHHYCHGDYKSRKYSRRCKIRRVFLLHIH